MVATAGQKLVLAYRSFISLLRQFHLLWVCLLPKLELHHKPSLLREQDKDVGEEGFGIAEKVCANQFCDDLSEKARE
jgi:hypothetical protein